MFVFIRLLIKGMKKGAHFIFKLLVIINGDL